MIDSTNTSAISTIRIDAALQGMARAEFELRVARFVDASGKSRLDMSARHHAAKRVLRALVLANSLAEMRSEVAA